jgi:hypothetical protein
MSIYVKYLAAVLGVCLLGALAILLFEDLWVQVGLGAAILVVCGGLLFLVWRTDRKSRDSRAGLDRV